MSIRLVDLNPAWIDLPADLGSNRPARHGLGVAYDPMVPVKSSMGAYRLWTLFANPLDGGPAWPGNSRSLILLLNPDPADVRWLIVGCGTIRWQCTGNTFETLSMTPSVDAHEFGHMTLTNGVFN